MKNIDKIREMNTEELAAFLSNFGTCHVCAFGESGDESCTHIKKLSDIPDCEDGLRKYLETEADEPEEEKEAEYSEQEIYYLLKTVRVLKDEASYERPFNGDNPSEEYERLRKAIYHLEDYMRKDLKLSTQIYVNHAYDCGLNERSEHCIDQLHDLMERYYQLAQKLQIDYKDTQCKKWFDKRIVAKEYWEIVKEYFLSRFYRLDEEIASCEFSIKTWKESLERYEKGDFF